MQLLFYTCATGKYNDFVLPYLTSALITNPDSAVEILTDQPDRFRNLKVPESFNGRFLIHSIPSRIFHWANEVHLASAIRFVVEPQIKAEYTYIGDVDITITQPVAEAHIEHMRKTLMAYSNVIRPGKHRLTGLHFVDTWKWYNRIGRKYIYDLVKWYEESDLRNDEALLYKITKDFFGLPDPSDEFRPIHGIHFSPNRTIDGDPGWGITKKRQRELGELIKTFDFMFMSTFFTKEYLEMVNQALCYTL